MLLLLLIVVGLWPAGANSVKRAPHWRGEQCVFLHLSIGSSAGLQVSLHAMWLLGLESSLKVGSICSSPGLRGSCPTSPHKSPML